MDSSDEDFLPDPERPRKRKEPPDRTGASTSKGEKTKNDETTNKQSGLCLHDVFNKGKCSFLLREVFQKKVEDRLPLRGEKKRF